ncbi:MAG: hypothetical protein M1115_02305, partial [Actinobacteria bacterium]|nr:hypothetical protein [Actinomycetota bacterium]
MLRLELASRSATPSLQATDVPFSPTKVATKPHRCAWATRRCQLAITVVVTATAIITLHSQARNDPLSLKADLKAERSGSSDGHW